MGRQSIGQIDAAHARQFIAGEPIEKGRSARAFDDMFGKGCGIHKPNPFADGASLFDRILPPGSAAEAAGFFVKIFRRIQRTKIIGPLPPVDPAKLCPASLLPIIGRRCAQRPRSRAFLIGVMQNIDMIIAFFVFAHGKFGGHPIAVAFGV